MKITGICIMGLIILALIGCKTSKNTTPQLTKADHLLTESIDAHGGDLYNKAHYKFIFRESTYTFQNNNGNYNYTVNKEKNGQVIFDQMDNQSFTRTIDSVETPLSEKDQTRYGSAINSVIYFATLPHKLQDPAVNLEIKKTTVIKGEGYNVLQVSFDQEGGGQDHDDIYYYWINQKTKLIDYLAYNFHVNKGGVRFRRAFNTRNVDGIVFQDYVNYKAPVGTPLSELPALYEEEKLTALSVIATEKVKAL